MFEYCHLSITEIEKLISEKEALSIVDFEYIVLLCSLADRYFYVNTNLTIAFELSKKAKNIAQTQNYQYGYALSLLPYSNCLIQFNKIQEAENSIIECISIFKKLNYPKGEAFAINIFADTLRSFGNYIQAFSELEKSLEIFLSICETRGVSMAFSIFAKISLDLEDYDAAIDYNQKALSYPNANFSNCRIYNNLGHIYYLKADYPNALNYLNNSLHDAGLVNDKYCISSALINLGNVYNATNEKVKATTYYEHGLSFMSKFGLPIDAYSSLKNLANIQIETGKFDEAINTLNKIKVIAGESNNSYLYNATSIKIASTLKLSNRSQEALNILNTVIENLNNDANSELLHKCHLTFSTIYEEQNNHEKALSHYKTYWKEREKFLNTKMREKIGILGSKSQIDGFLSQRQIRKEKDIELAGAYDELVEYDEKLHSANLKINDLTNKLEHWKKLLPLCKTCEIRDLNDNSINQVKKNIENHPSNLNQTENCVNCYQTKENNDLTPNVIFETAGEIYVFEPQ